MRPLKQSEILLLAFLGLNIVLPVGQAEQAAPLLKILDGSPLFQNSEFTGSVSRTSDNFELFRIKVYRRRR